MPHTEISKEYLKESGRPVVLVVDDEAEIAKILNRGLTLQGFDVEVAHSGEEALQLLSERSFDVLLTDVHMPRMRGDELQRRARALNPELAILLITAASDISLAVSCLQEGVFDYITKPFDLKDVAFRIGRALERNRLIQENREHQETLSRRVEEQSAHLRTMFQDSLQALNRALEAKDEGTRDHSTRVSQIALALAKRLYPEETEFQDKLRVTALLHDIGKIGVSERILNKPDRLTVEEFDEIKKHPVIGEEILRPIFHDLEMLEIVRHHHESWDGGGYPDQLCGEAIPRGARLIAVADTYDALTSNRPYRAGLPVENALDVLRNGSGQQWEACIVQTLLELAETGELFHLSSEAPQWERRCAA